MAMASNSAPSPPTPSTHSKPPTPPIPPTPPRPLAAPRAHRLEARPRDTPGNAAAQRAQHEQRARGALDRNAEIARRLRVLANRISPVAEAGAQQREGRPQHQHGKPDQRHAKAARQQGARHDGAHRLGGVAGDGEAAQVQAASRPRKTCMVPSVTMKEPRPVRMTSKPLTRPSAAEMASAPRNASAGGSPIEEKYTVM